MMNDLIHKSELFNRIASVWTIEEIYGVIQDMPTADDVVEKLEKCRFEYINACKTVDHPTPDTSKQDLYDAYAVIKALNPIFGKENYD